MMALLCIIQKNVLHIEAVNILACKGASLRTLLLKFLDIALVMNYPVTLGNVLEYQRPQVQHSKKPGILHVFIPAEQENSVSETTTQTNNHPRLLSENKLLAVISIYFYF